MIRVTTVDWVPPFARGLLRDLRLRWALEEAGLSYEMKFVPLMGRDDPGYRALQPFGQIPTYEEEGLKLFETGAILLRLAEKSPALAPAKNAANDAAKDATRGAEWAEMTQWLFAALNTVEPQLQAITMHDRFHKDKDWFEGARASVVEIAEKRLGDLAQAIAGRPYLAAGRFTVADIAMTTVLRIPGHTDLVTSIPALAAYLEAMEARPAFQKALAAQLADIDANAPKG